MTLLRPATWRGAPRSRWVFFPSIATHTTAAPGHVVVDVAPLGPTLGPGGPVKVLHDLTFDARMLLDAGVLLQLREPAFDRGIVADVEPNNHQSAALEILC